MRDACAQVRELRGPWGVRGRHAQVRMLRGPWGVCGHAQVRYAQGAVGCVREVFTGEGCSGGRGV